MKGAKYMISEEYIVRLLEILDKKYKLLEEMFALTERQSKVIDEDKLDSLEDFVRLKQVKINEIDKLDEQFGVYFARLKNSLNIKSFDELDKINIIGAGQLKERTGKILELISRISLLEKDNGRKAQELLDSIGEQIKKLNVGRKISSVYENKSVNAPSFFIDKKK